LERRRGLQGCPGERDRLPAFDGEQGMAVDPSMPILVVDDYNTMIRIIRNLLRQLGYEDVDDAADGASYRYH
jgi:PleD family two-component response regulator